MKSFFSVPPHQPYSDLQKYQLTLCPIKHKSIRFPRTFIATMQVQSLITAVAALIMSIGPAFAVIPQLEVRGDSCADVRNLRGSGCVVRGRYSCSADSHAVVSDRLPPVLFLLKFPLPARPVMLPSPQFDDPQMVPSQKGKG
jgi:hypothetical protein